MEFIKLAWRNKYQDIIAQPFIFGDDKPSYPFYMLASNGNEVGKLEQLQYQPWIVTGTNGATMMGTRLGSPDCKYFDIETAKQICQNHFENWIKQFIIEENQ